MPVEVATGISHEASAASLDDIDISDELLSRPIGKPDRKGEITALYALAASRQNLSTFLKRLSDLAINLCDADSAGVSLIEASPGEAFFRWVGLAGELERYTGGTTPRDWSPCGESLKARRAILYSYPERHFTYLAEVERPIVEGLIIPMFFGGVPVGTVWIVSHTPTRRFDGEHVRIMTSIGGFATSALQAWRGSAWGDRLRTNPPENAGTNEGPLSDRYAGEGITSPSGKPTADREVVWAELMERVSRRDELAFETVFHETYALVFATVLRVVSFPADAEEITADVYSRVWTLASIFDPSRGTVGSWLVTIARRCGIDRLRSRVVRNRYEKIFSLQSRHEDFDEGASQTFERELLREALQSLPLHQRQVIELFYLSELSATEIAAKLRQPIGTVKTRIRMGRIKLRLILASLATCSTRPDTRYPIKQSMGVVTLRSSLPSEFLQA